MIHLQDSQIIGRGSERDCYRHPQDPRLCIKITYKTNRKNTQNARDYAYLNSLKRRKIDWSYLPRCHGWVDTDKGDGLVFDFMRDNEGRPLKSLKQLLTDGVLTYDSVVPSLNNLYRYFLENLIFTSDLRDSNIVCDVDQKGSPMLYVIDGVGNRDFIKAAARFPPLGRAKVNRQWSRFMKRMELRWAGGLPVK